MGLPFLARKDHENQSPPQPNVNMASLKKGDTGYIVAQNTHVDGKQWFLLEYHNGPVRPENRQRGWAQLGDKVAVGVPSGPITPESGWPIGYPWLTDRKWYECPPAGEERVQVARIEPGDCGKVISTHFHRGTGVRWVNVTIIHRKEQGWVPLPAIKVGTARKFGDWRVEMKSIEPSNIPLNIHVTPTGDGQFMRAITGLYRTIVAQREHLGLHFLPEYLWNQIGNEGENIHQFAARMVNAVHQANPGLVGVLNTSCFTLEQVINAAKVIEPSNKAAGVYIIAYRDLDGDITQAAVYIGMTGEFAKRKQGHYQARTSPSDKMYNRWHYCQARRAKRIDMRILATLDVLEERLTLENTFSLLLQTERASVLATSGSLSQVIDEDDEDVQGSFANPDEQTNTTTKDAGKVSRYINDKQAARALSLAANLAQKDSSWPGACRRPADPASSERVNSFGASIGMQWSSAWREATFGRGDTLIWTRVINPGRYENFRRPAYLAREGTHTRILFDLTRKYSVEGSINLSFDMPKSIKEPAAGTWVYPVFEVRIDGEPHPVPYARVARTGPWSDWHLANTLGVRIEFQRQSGEWCAMWLQLSKAHIIINTDIPGSETGYEKAMTVLRTLRHETIRNPYGFEHLPLVHPRIRDLRLEFLTQKLVTEDQSPFQESTVNAPRRRSLDEIGRDYKAAGLQQVNEWVGQAKSFGGHSRGTCDRCYLAQGKAKCKRFKDTLQCEHCYVHGRPCSWTDSEWLLNKGSADQGVTSRKGATVIPYTFQKDLYETLIGIVPVKDHTVVIEAAPEGTDA